MKVFGLKINFWLLLVLGLIGVLRIPSLIEPNWYGDEQIYLVLGREIARGAVLYRDIWDNKPPLLYVLYALHPTLLWAKALATVFVLGTCTGVYLLAKKVLSNHSQPNPTPTTVFPLLATLAVGIFMSLPLLEGTIANAELFFTLPIVWGGYLIVCHAGPDPASIKLFNGFRVIPGMTIVGLLMAAAFLLKVPAIFDFAGMIFAVVLIRLARGGLASSASPPLAKLVRFILPIAISFLALLILVFGYFYFNNALADFLIASFSQNASYVAVDSGPLSKLSNPLFVKAILLVASGLLLVASYFKRFISKEMLFLALWFGFSLYGAILSNRPYAHYLLQIVPPLVLLILYVLYDFLFIRKNRLATIVVGISLCLILFALSQMFARAFALPTKPYFENWFEYVSERKLWEDYVSFFDKRTLNSYAIADYIKKRSNPDDPIFVWGDAAGVYVLSNRPAAIRFIQAHHLTTIDPANYDALINQLIKVRPKFIIISRPVHFAFPLLEDLVSFYYKEVAVFQDLHVYQLADEKNF
ncbi:MAG: Glycosyl transferase, family 39 [Microgenomates group bacterium GW2011_GWA1_48_10]|uniref:Glycosyltransferase RgtA/B/C/D-like domain-containing protein n=1 Tax=Candidatus Gottesmanbacteria bacterium RIFCSPHIGHO2_01_FULL_47_48 TaxID=1798381 RepID=A0A1F5ZZM6_9BACT|nr:MAG: Glycosyl transferase, family 39 [Microgenomates group bacterium GW2011_GWA1_48_10]OGG17804.1 MAG: hypothetical protein A2721_02165 [Candidatus Gottesmanbacteria bacterium RIFCSPHIGHO2_01_FULL_47_48]